MIDHKEKGQVTLTLVKCIMHVCNSWDLDHFSSQLPSLSVLITSLSAYFPHNSCVTSLVYI